MTQADHRDEVAGADLPAGDVLPLRRPAGHGVRLTTLVADVIRAVGPAVPRDRDGVPLVRIDCEIDPATSVDLPATGVRRLLESLVRAAVAAACRIDPAAATPPLREVVLTAVDLGAAIEIEVADSGPTRPVASAAVVAAERFGARLDAIACAEGGMAMTLRIPRSQVVARAA